MKIKANRESLKEALEKELKLQETELENDNQCINDYVAALASLTGVRSKNLIKNAKSDVEVDRFIRAMLVYAIKKVKLRLDVIPDDVVDPTVVDFDDLKDSLFK